MTTPRYPTRLLGAPATALGLAALALTPLGAGCDDSSSAPSAPATVTPDAGGASDGDVAATPDVPEEPTGPVVFGSCLYENLFSGNPECMEYLGEGWDEASASASCSSPLAGTAGDLTIGAACAFESELGRCAVSTEDDLSFELVLSGSDASNCGASETSCTVFLEGVFTPSDVCEGGQTGGGPQDPPEITGAFIWPYEVCSEPLDGEPAGDGPDGTVCTKTLISGCTEEGRRYEDYASCEVVRTNRPYYPVDTTPEPIADDPRLDDEVFMSELAWVTSQVEACACVCCHTDSLTPAGVSSWDTEAPGVWTDSIPDTGVAMLSGLADSTSFGAYPPTENNGFERDTAGMPSTDPERMRQFFLDELARRELTEQWAKELPGFGGPLASQLAYEPEACKFDEGVRADGTVVWANADIRYLYVMESGTASPGVPPNLDLPEGVMWRIDVPHTEAALEPGVIEYGVVPEAASQTYPVGVPPEALVEGQQYYLYALIDVGFPITRCLFTYPIE